ncbi:hypothetical protein A2U01_0111362, partial [Trifolium medium]|nr:hypothetical protein [Trifolium medium]
IGDISFCPPEKWRRLTTREKESDDSPFKSVASVKTVAKGQLQRLGKRRNKPRR